MRRAANVDANQAEIVQALVAAGCTVQSLAPVGGGVPDLLVGFKGINYLLEVKDGRKPPSARRLRPSQVEWHARWKGQVIVVKDVAEALAIIGARIAA